MAPFASTAVETVTMAARAWIVPRSVSSATPPACSEIAETAVSSAWGRPSARPTMKVP